VSLDPEDPTHADPAGANAGGLRERLGRGPLAFMAGNPVAANLFMLLFIVGGLLSATRIKQEVFPEFNLNLVRVQLVYPGASPAEVEQGALLAVEEAVRGVDGVKEVRATAREGGGHVTIELRLGADRDQVLSDVKSAVDRITSFPEDMERPAVSLVEYRNQVLTLVLYGDQREETLKSLAEQARDELLNDPRVTQIELGGVRPPEIGVEVPQESLRRFGLTLDQIAARIRQASIELPGGGVKAASGEVLLRTTERRDRGRQFADIDVISRPDGSTVKLGEIARIDDGFRETDEATYFNGKPAVLVQVFRVGDQTPVGVAEAVKEYLAELKERLPPGVQVALWNDTSQLYQERVDLLLRNGRMGLLLVFLTLALLLEIRLAFWVTLGIPISFLGAMLFLPAWDVSVNMISLFAFIVTLGIVVDDAIVVGESVYEHRRRGKQGLAAAIAGVKEVAVPVTFSILTTLVAFAPMLFVPGASGRFFRNVPLVVFGVLGVSLIESLLILPAHLARDRAPGKIVRWIDARQAAVTRLLDRFIERLYRPAVITATRNRYLSWATGIAVLLATLSLIAGGRILFTFFPKIDTDQARALVTLPYGSPVGDTRAVLDRLVQAAHQVMREHGNDQMSRGLMVRLGAWDPEFRAPGQVDSSGSHLGQVSIYFVPAHERTITSAQFLEAWRQAAGEIPGVETISFQYAAGPGAQAPIDLQLSHRDLAVLERAAEEAAARLGEFAGVRDVDPGFTRGKEQIDFKLTPAARSLGITELDLARQVRAAFFGAEAVRLQRGRDELRVYVRLPREQRSSEYDIDQLLLRTPQGGEVPLAQAATLERGSSYTQIFRTDGRRTVFVTADVQEGTDANQIVGSMMTEVLPALAGKHPGLRFGYGGQQKEQQESLQALALGFVVAVLVIFGLIAVGLRSYVQPLIILSAIPFGLVGAVFGHLVMGFDLSLISMFGLVAVSGVVVNDSIVLVHATNRFRDQGMTAEQAAIAAGSRRFRPVLLTSLTTFFGLIPIVFETSVQARFLVPMAISIAFGVLFSTGTTLFLVPSAVVIINDVKRGLARLLGGDGRAPAKGGP
jgi:multidrug efflux pump subunit AcrB